jgi:hypothetical protein
LQHWSASATWCCSDEGEDLERVGSLERDQPILLLIETLRHKFFGPFRRPKTEVRERRQCIWHGRGRRGENPKEMKTQERIGSSR